MEEINSTIPAILNMNYTIMEAVTIVPITSSLGPFACFLMAFFMGFFAAIIGKTIGAPIERVKLIQQVNFTQTESEADEEEGFDVRRNIEYLSEYGSMMDIGR